MIQVYPFLRWAAPSLLWDLAVRDSDLVRFEQPTLLAFPSPSFVTDLMKQLTPAGMAGLVALPEPAAPNQTTPGVPPRGWLVQEDWLWYSPLKLYQPGVARYYLVAASLVAQAPGLPDHPVNPAEQEEVGFVYRRLSAMGELAFREDSTWAPAPDPAQLIDGEHLIGAGPLLVPGTGYPGRQIWVAAVPAFRQSAYDAAPLVLPPEPLPPSDPVLSDLLARIDAMYALPAVTDPVQAAAFSTMLLLSLVTFLNRYLPNWVAENPFQPPWSENLQAIWASRAELIAGIAGSPTYSLSSVLRPEDLPALIDWVSRQPRALDQFYLPDPYHWPPQPMGARSDWAVPELNPWPDPPGVMRPVWRRRVEDGWQSVVGAPSAPFLMPRLTLTAQPSQADLQAMKPIIEAALKA